MSLSVIVGFGPCLRFVGNEKNTKTLQAYPLKNTNEYLQRLFEPGLCGCTVHCDEAVKHVCYPDS